MTEAFVWWIFPLCVIWHGAFITWYLMHIQHALEDIARKK